MKRVVLIAVLLMLSACGVDGPPLPVTSDTTAISITGEARTGVAPRF